MDENGAKCISLVLVEAGTYKEEFGGFVFKKRWRSTMRPLSTDSVTIMWTVPGQQR